MDRYGKTYTWRNSRKWCNPRGCCAGLVWLYLHVTIIVLFNIHTTVKLPWSPFAWPVLSKFRFCPTDINPILACMTASALHGSGNKTSPEAWQLLSIRFVLCELAQWIHCYWFWEDACYICGTKWFIAIHGDTSWYKMNVNAVYCSTDPDIQSGNMSGSPRQGKIPFHSCSILDAAASPVKVLSE